MYDLGNHQITLNMMQALFQYKPPAGVSLLAEHANVISAH